MLRRAREQLHAYFDNELKEFALPLAPAGTAYQQRVWQALCAIPHGATRSYLDIARVAGGRHRTWRVLRSTKSLGDTTNGVLVKERPRRLSARPDPPEPDSVSTSGGRAVAGAADVPSATRRARHLGLRRRAP